MLMSLAGNSYHFNDDNSSQKTKHKKAASEDKKPSNLHFVFQRMSLCSETRMRKTQKSLAYSAQQGECRLTSAFHYTGTILLCIKLLIKPSFAVPSLKAMLCVSITWRTSEQLLMVHLPTERDLSIAGHLTRTESPTHDLDL